MVNLHFIYCTHKPIHASFMRSASSYHQYLNKHSEKPEIILCGCSAWATAPCKRTHFRSFGDPYCFHLQCETTIQWFLLIHVAPVYRSMRTGYFAFQSNSQWQPRQENRLYFSYITVGYWYQMNKLLGRYPFMKPYEMSNRFQISTLSLDTAEEARLTL
jgi:hypothetical protein